MIRAPFSGIYACLGAVSVLLVLTGCARQVPSVSDQITAAAPAAYHHAAIFSQNAAASSVMASGQTACLDAWLELMPQVMAHNPSLEAMTATVARLRYEAAAKGGYLSPSVDIKFNAHQTDGSGDFSGHARHQVSLPSSYELDIWGRLEGIRQQAVFHAAAAEEDQRALMLTLVAEAMANYVAGLELKERRIWLKDAVRTAFEIAHIEEKRYRLGASDKMPWNNALQELGDYKVLQEEAAKELSEIGHRLKILGGDYPEDDWLKGVFCIPKFLENIAPGLPSELVARRPDLKALRSEVTSAQWGAQAVGKEIFPVFSLTADGGAGSSSLNELLSGKGVFWSIMETAAAHLLDGTGRKYRSRAEKQRVEEALAKYKKGLLTAFREVEDALILGARQWKIVQERREAASSLQENVKIAELRLFSGASDRISLLKQRRGYIDAEMQRLETEVQLIFYRIQLLRSLGGDWWLGPDDPPPSSHRPPDHK
jgi:multidrug efflux system outer membrane protein